MYKHNSLYNKISTLNAIRFDIFALYLDHHRKIRFIEIYFYSEIAINFTINYKDMSVKTFY